MLAETEDLQTMPFDREIVAASQLADGRFDRARGEGNDIAAVRADQVMPVTGFADHIGGMTVRSEQPGKNIDRCHDRQGTKARGPADTGQELDGQLGGEGRGLPYHRLDHVASRPRGAVSVFGENRKRL